MAEILQEAFSTVNVGLTVLLIVIILYWISVILGVLDVEMFDFDIDADIDVDIDADVDIAGGGFMHSVMEFFYFGEVPIMFLVSILILNMWVISMISNHCLNQSGSMLIALLLFAGNFLLSAFITKLIATPVKKLYAGMNEDCNAPRDVVGRRCIVTTTVVSDRLGQAEVRDGGAPILLNVITVDGTEMHKGDEAVVVSRDDEKGLYFIAPFDINKQRE